MIKTQLVAGMLSSSVEFIDVNGQRFEIIPGKCQTNGDNAIFAVCTWRQNENKLNMYRKPT